MVFFLQTVPATCFEIFSSLASTDKLFQACTPFKRSRNQPVSEIKQ